jgi:hypothetical protein
LPCKTANYIWFIDMSIRMAYWWHNLPSFTLLILIYLRSLSHVYQVARVWGPLTHETESPWPLHFKHSHWWKRQSHSKFASHYAWGTKGIYMWNARWMWSLHGFLYGIEWIMFHGHLHCFQKPLLGGRPNTKPADHGTLNAYHRWFILLYHVWGPAWINIDWNIIRLKAQSHMTSH